MKIQIKNCNKISITATGLSDSLTKEEIMKITGGMYDVIDLVLRHDSKPLEQVTKTVQENPVHPQVSTPLIRPRIPNNVVDIKELDIKQAVTEEALVRCPHCGQAHCLVVNAESKVYLMKRDFDKNEFNIIAVFDSLTSNGFAYACCKPDTDRLDYFNDLQNAPIVSYEDFVANNETDVFCPVCCTSHPFIGWKDAYENPLKYFETEHLCDVCGGEKLEKIIKDKKVYLCDSCGYQTEYKEE